MKIKEIRSIAREAEEAINKSRKEWIDKHSNHFKNQPGFGGIAGNDNSMRCMYCNAEWNEVDILNELYPREER